MKKILLTDLFRDGKGVPELFSALAELRNRRRDFILEIAGDGPNREKYRRLGDELGLGNSVRFRGMINREELAEMIRNADFLVQPSELETFGMTVIEALACGKPVVAKEIPPFQKMISNRRGILVPPGRSGAMAAALDRMLDRYPEYRPGLLAGYVEENFGYRAVGERLNTIYGSVLAARSKRR